MPFLDRSNNNINNRRRRHHHYQYHYTLPKIIKTFKDKVRNPIFRPITFRSINIESFDQKVV